MSKRCNSFSYFENRIAFIYRAFTSAFIAPGITIDAQLLWRQVALWRPWVLLLMAGWYEMRWRQSGDRQFITLADEIWCQLDNERKG